MASRDDPARARIGRVVAYFYLPPPTDVSPVDELPVGAPAPPAKLLAGRMFIAEVPLLRQAQVDSNKLGGLGLRFHAIRRPLPRVPVAAVGSGVAAAAAAAVRSPLQVLLLSM